MSYLYKEIDRRFNALQHKWNLRFEFYERLISLNCIPYSQLEDVRKLGYDIASVNPSFDLNHFVGAFRNDIEAARRYGVIFPVKHKRGFFWLIYEIIAASCRLCMLRILRRIE